VPSLAAAARSALLPLPEVTELTSLRRSTSLFSQGQPADSVYVIEEGMVKLTRTSAGTGRIILGIFGPGQLVGEEALLDGVGETYYAEAEVLAPSTVIRAPRSVVAQMLTDNPEFSAAFYAGIIRQKAALAQKVELLCLHDVEYRILHYLEQLSALAPRQEGAEGHQLPITQLELADLIGATRETTSTTLNQLERRGLVKLSRRLLTIPSPRALAAAAHSKTMMAGETSVAANQ
jgi:CRP/FNR family cyclic AMP-dependent transcriptional regulator